MIRRTANVCPATPTAAFIACRTRCTSESTISCTDAFRSPPVFRLPRISGATSRYGAWSGNCSASSPQSTRGGDEEEDDAGSDEDEEEDEGGTLPPEL